MSFPQYPNGNNKTFYPEDILNNTAETKTKTHFLNKKIVFFNLWWLCGLPALAVCLLTAIASFLTLNYEYLPAETDFLAGVFYDASYIVLDAAICICIGAFCWAVYTKNALSSLITGVLAFICGSLMPMLMFFVRSIFLAAVSSADIMEEYFSVDVYVAVANTLKLLTAVIIVLAVRAALFFGKKEMPLSRPILSPKSEPLLCALIMTAANLLFITVSFTFSEEYDFISLGIQAAFAVISYFIIALGVYLAKKKCEK